MQGGAGVSKPLEADRVPCSHSYGRHYLAAFQILVEFHLSLSHGNKGARAATKNDFSQLDCLFKGVRGH